MIPLLSHKHSILLPLHHVLADLFRFARCPSVSCGGIDFREASSRTTLPSYQETSRGNSSHFLLLRRPAYHHFSWLLPCPRFAAILLFSDWPLPILFPSFADLILMNYFYCCVAFSLLIFSLFSCCPNHLPPPSLAPPPHSPPPSSRCQRRCRRQSAFLRRGKSGKG